MGSVSARAVIVGGCKCGDAAYDRTVAGYFEGQARKVVEFDYEEVEVGEGQGIRVEEMGELVLHVAKVGGGAAKGFNVKMVQRGTLRREKLVMQGARGWVKWLGKAERNATICVVGELGEDVTRVIQGGRSSSGIRRNNLPVVTMHAQHFPFGWTGKNGRTSNVRVGDVVTFNIFQDVGDEMDVYAKDIEVKEFATEYREEGVVTVVKEREGFGFIRVAGRGCDAYFRIDDALAGSDVVKQGSVVSFDFFVDANKRGVGRPGDCFKAGRIKVEDGERNWKVKVGEGVKGKVVKSKGTYGGTVDFVTPVKVELDLLKTVFKSFFAVVAEVSGEEGRNSVVLPDTLSEEEKGIFKSLDLEGVSVREAKNSGLLTLTRREVGEGDDKHAAADGGGSDGNDGAEAETPPPPPASDFKTIRRASFVDLRVGKYDSVTCNVMYDMVPEGRKGGGFALSFRAEDLDVVGKPKGAEAAGNFLFGGKEFFGFVADVNLQRHFGFINAVNVEEEELKQRLFFHLTEVQADGEGGGEKPMTSSSRPAAAGSTGKACGFQTLAKPCPSREATRLSSGLT